MEKLIKLLEEQRGNWISGEDIAIQCGVSRATIWKRVKKLKERNYLIESSSKLGYRLAHNSDVINVNQINQLLNFDTEVIHLDTVTSTNDYLRSIITDTLPSFTVVISDQQTHGKGRKGRSFYSPDSNGIYMSILIRPSFSTEIALQLTAMIAVAASEAIDSLYLLDTKIKWVNDLYIKDFKVAGILCEGQYEIDSNSFSYIIVGIGINTKKQVFPEELKEIVSSIENHINDSVNRNILIAEILNRFKYHYDNQTNFIATYKNKSNLINTLVEVIEPNNTYIAKVIDINNQAHLIVESEGKIIELSSSEVSILRRNK